MKPHRDHNGRLCVLAPRCPGGAEFLERDVFGPVFRCGLCGKTWRWGPDGGPWKPLTDKAERTSHG